MMEEMAAEKIELGPYARNRGGIRSKAYAIWPGMCGSGCWMNIRTLIEERLKMTHLYAKSLDVGKIPRGACSAAGVGASSRLTSVQRAGSAAPPTAGTSTSGFASQDEPLNPSPLGPLKTHPLEDAS